jgi:hypothetical protein
MMEGNIFETLLSNKQEGKGVAKQQGWEISSSEGGAG